MHNLFLVYFVNLYMFRAHLGPLSGGKPYVYNNWYLLFFLYGCLLSWSNQDNRQTYKKNNKYQLLYTYGLPPDNGPRCARNM